MGIPESTASTKCDQETLQVADKGQLGYKARAVPSVRCEGLYDQVKRSRRLHLASLVKFEGTLSSQTKSFIVAPIYVPRLAARIISYKQKFYYRLDAPVAKNGPIIWSPKKYLPKNRIIRIWDFGIIARRKIRLQAYAYDIIVYYPLVLTNRSRYDLGRANSLDIEAYIYTTIFLDRLTISVIDIVSGNSIITKQQYSKNYFPNQMNAITFKYPIYSTRGVVKLSIEGIRKDKRLIHEVYHLGTKISSKIRN